MRRTLSRTAAAALLRGTATAAVSSAIVATATPYSQKRAAAQLRPGRWVER